MLSSGPERKRKKMKYHCFKNIPHCHWWKFKKWWKGWCSFKPQLAPWKGESLHRAPPAVLLGTAYRPASFSWASGELNLTETSSPPRFFREGFVQASAKVRRPFHLDGLRPSPWGPEDAKEWSARTCWIKRFNWIFPNDSDFLRLKL